MNNENLVRVKVGVGFLLLNEEIIFIHGKLNLDRESNDEDGDEII